MRLSRHRRPRRPRRHRRHRRYHFNIHFLSCVAHSALIFLSSQNDFWK